MLKEKFSLDDVYKKLFEPFFDSISSTIVIKEQSDSIKINRKMTFENEFRVLVAENFYTSEGQALFNSNSQNVNAITSQKSIKQNKHSEGALYKDILIRIASLDAMFIEEEHLKRLIRNSINKWSEHQKSGTHSSCDEIQEKFETDVVKILRQEFPLTIHRMEKKFLDEKLDGNGLYKYLARMIFFSLLYCIDYSIMGDSDKKKVNELISTIEKNLGFSGWKKEFSGNLSQLDKLTYLNLEEALILEGVDGRYSKIAGQIRENDQRMYMDIERHMYTRPETWGFLVLKNKIVGNFSYLFLNRELEEKILSGNFLGNAEIGVNPQQLIGNSDCSIYVRDVFVNRPYGMNEWQILFKELSKKIVGHIRDGIFINSIYICGFGEYAQKYRENGFVFCAERMGGRKIYKLDMKSELARKSDWINSEKVAFDKNLFNFRKLQENEQLSGERLKEISLLIYDTDPYIYKSLLKREDAEKVFPTLFEMRDTMFNLSNIYVAMLNGEKERIVGTILFKKGPLNWRSDNLRSVAKFMGIPLSENLNKVESEYFAKYNDVDDKTISILNCFTNQIFTTIYGYALEDSMLKEFIKEHSEENLELFVLRETPEEFLVYAKNQFELVEMVNGYAEDSRDLPCGHMRRVAKKKE